MIDFLVKQTDMDCLPAALPDKQIAHKTSALDGLYDDGGIIYSDAGDAVLVIMTENFTGEYNTIQHMKAFARAVIDKKIFFGSTEVACYFFTPKIKACYLMPILIKSEEKIFT